MGASLGQGCRSAGQGGGRWLTCPAQDRETERRGTRVGGSRTELRDSSAVAGMQGGWTEEEEGRSRADTGRTSRWLLSLNGFQ